MDTTTNTTHLTLSSDALALLSDVLDVHDDDAALAEEAGSEPAVVRELRDAVADAVEQARGDRVCSSCGRTLPLTKFPTRAALKGTDVRTRGSECRECRDARLASR